VTDPGNDPPADGAPPPPGTPPLIPEPPDTAPPGVIPEPPGQAPFDTPAFGQTPPPGDIPPPAPGDYRPMDVPARRGGSVGRRIGIVVLALLLLGGLGAILNRVREATASPKDKAACTATGTMIETDGQTLTEAMQTWNAADDSKIRAEIANVQSAIAARDPQALADSVNRVIARCNKISSDFRKRFNTYCKTHEGACKKTFNF